MLEIKKKRRVKKNRNWAREQKKLLRLNIATGTHGPRDSTPSRGGKKVLGFVKTGGFGTVENNPGKHRALRTHRVKMPMRTQEEGHSRKKRWWQQPGCDGRSRERIKKRRNAPAKPVNATGDGGERVDKTPNAVKRKREVPRTLKKRAQGPHPMANRVFHKGKN